MLDKSKFSVISKLVYDGKRTIRVRGGEALLYITHYVVDSISTQDNYLCEPQIYFEK